jgi:hypothetical protein
MHAHGLFYFICLEEVGIDKCEWCVFERKNAAVVFAGLADFGFDSQASSRRAAERLRHSATTTGPFRITAWQRVKENLPGQALQERTTWVQFKQGGEGTHTALPKQETVGPFENPGRSNSGRTILRRRDEQSHEDEQTQDEQDQETRRAKSRR